MSNSLAPLVIVLLVLVVAVSNYLRSKRQKRAVERFISTRTAISDLGFLQSLDPDLRIGTVAVDVRNLACGITGIPAEFIYGSDVVGELLSQAKSEEDFSDRFSDFAMFSVPDDFEIAPSETISEVIRRLIAANQNEPNPDS